MRGLVALCCLLASFCFAQEDLAFAEALVTGGVQEVRVWLESGVDVTAPLDVVNVGGSTPIYFASLNSDPAVVRLLLDAGADVNTRGEGGLTPLMLAAMANPSSDVMWALVEGGADISARDEAGRTALARAAAANRPEVVEVLLQAGANVNERYHNGYTPLHVAAGSNCADMLRLLIEAGADVNALASIPTESTPLSTVLATAENPIAWRMARVDDGFTQEACPNDVVERRMRVLLEAGADPNVLTWFEPLLIHAVRLGFLDGVRLLIDAGADLEARGRSGRTALLWAGVEDDPFYGRSRYDARPSDLLRVLIQAGADVNAVARPADPALVREAPGLEPDHLSDTALIQAARRGDLESARLLVEAGARLDARNAEGRTALIVAVRHRNYQVAGYLIDSGADISLRDDAGKSALDYDGYGSPVYKRLGGRVVDADIFALARYADAETLATTLETTAFDLSSVDTYGQTLLTYAAGHNPDPNVIEALVMRGADVNHRDHFGWTPLMHAARDNPNPDVTRRLLDLGAYHALENDNHQTALWIASTAGRTDMMQVLLAHGADALEPYLLGETARQASLEALVLLLDELPKHPGSTRVQTELNRALVRAIYPDPDQVADATDKVRRLLHAGAEPDAITVYPNSTMLAVAAESGRLELVRLLVGAGADIDGAVGFQYALGEHRGVTTYTCTPLALAAMRGHRDVVEFLLDAGADPAPGSDRLSSACRYPNYLDEAEFGPELLRRLRVHPRP